jgi:DNA repair protein RadC
MRAITAWAEEDRPREKLMLKGRQALSDAELLAILIGSGTIGQSAVALAQEILASVANNLHDLGKMSLKDLQDFKGIGEAKAITIAAALELGRRRQRTDLREKPCITSSQDAFNLIAPMLNDLHHEEFWLILLNRANEVIHCHAVSKGGSTGTVVDIKQVFKTALDANATSVIAIHNHPSGSLNPSQQDREVTQKLKSAGKVLECPLLDHLIVSERGYYSFADQGLL